MPKPTCSVLECESPIKGRGLCNKHLIRVRRHGNTDAYFPNKILACTIPECGQPHHARGWCVKHWNRWKSTGDPLAVRPSVNPVMVGADNPKWGGDAIGYAGAHLRMWRDDPASGHRCAHCLGPAENWAYDHADPDERQSERGPFSVKREHYIALCYSCHTKFDKARPCSR